MVNRDTNGTKQRIGRSSGKGKGGKELAFHLFTDRGHALVIQEADTNRVGGDGQGKDEPPQYSLKPNLLTQAVEESEKGELDGPQAGPGADIGSQVAVGERLYHAGDVIEVNGVVKNIMVRLCHQVDGRTDSGVGDGRG